VAFGKTLTLSEIASGAKVGENRNLDYYFFGQIISLEAMIRGRAFSGTYLRCARQFRLCGEDDAAWDQ
jgi:hypothetical protein